MVFIIFILAIGIINFIIGKNMQQYSMILTFIMAIATIGNIIIMLQYANHLKKQKCECSDTDTRILMQGFAIFQIIMLLFGVIVTIYSSLIFSKILNKKHLKINK
jgi:hypothetical protein